MSNAGAWYRYGTIDVIQNDIAVVGIGTLWLTDLIAVAVGDSFSTDGDIWYEIIAVDTDLSLTLQTPYLGATDSGINYMIQRSTSGTMLTRLAGQIAVQFNQKQLMLDELYVWLNSVNETENITDSHGITHAITTLFLVIH